MVDLAEQIGCASQSWLVPARGSMAANKLSGVCSSYMVEMLETCLSWLHVIMRQQPIIKYSVYVRIGYAA